MVLPYNEVAIAETEMAVDALRELCKNFHKKSRYYDTALREAELIKDMADAIYEDIKRDYCEPYETEI